jgi:hypothetical protein
MARENRLGLRSAVVAAWAGAAIVLLAACNPASVKTPVPSRIDPVTCPAGQMRICIG